MEKILISGCLLGEKVRYDGNSSSVNSQILEKWDSEKRLITVCPEVAGGLPVPRQPAEIAVGDGEDVLRGGKPVINRDGIDVTRYFLAGARNALEICITYQIKIALFKSRSPSCGSGFIYDGSFSRKLRPGDGVTAALLKKNGVRVYTEEEISAALEYIVELEEAK